MLKQILDNQSNNWYNNNFHDYPEEYKLVDISCYTSEFMLLSAKTNGNFNLGVKRIEKVQNPYLYAQYLLRKAEYELKGYTQVKELFHDTAESKIHSIVSNNLDWRLFTRVKYGQGVSFSPSPAYANRESSRNNGQNRAMIIADVLVHMPETVAGCQTLPSDGYDTTIGNCNNVYVKYYDDEFYPKYVVYYTSKPHVQYYRRRYW